EDGLFPLARAYDEPDTLEEERRLFYVGITRARRKLYLTYARSRRRAGEAMACVPSSFLDALPEELLDRRTSATLARSRYRSERFWRERVAAGGGFASDDAFDASEPGGLVIDYSDAQDTPRFIKGERVRHPQFGRGIIRELSGFGRDMKAGIEYETVGRKKVVLRDANLQKEL